MKREREVVHVARFGTFEDALQSRKQLKNRREALADEESALRRIRISVPRGDLGGEYGREVRVAARDREGDLIPELVGEERAEHLDIVDVVLRAP